VRNRLVPCEICALTMLCLLAACSTTAARPAPSEKDRIVFIGDSITDGHTLILLVEKALADAGKPVPKCINAAVAGDMAKPMRARIKRDVLVHRPTLVAMSVGINDAMHDVPFADYKADVTAISDQLKAAGVPMLILTTTVLGPKTIAKEKNLDGYNAFLRDLAKERGYAVADVFARMDKARKGDAELLATDHVHLEFDGYREMAAAVLEGLGYPGLPVAESVEPKIMPGVIARWKMRAAKKGEAPLDAETVLALKPDAEWKDFTLPEAGPLDHWWPEQERKRGFAQSLSKLVGEGGRHIGVAVLTEDKPRDVYFNTGAQLQTVWLNGKRIYRSGKWTGWHAGKERVPVHLNAGANTVVIEAGGSFFLSVTESNDW